MSSFDKLVAQWVSSAESRPREEREAMLSKISKNLETYRELENPSEAYARKQAEKRHLEDEKKAEAEQRRQEEERQRQLEAARQRERDARRASLPPLPPSASASASANPARGATATTTEKHGSRVPRPGKGSREAKQADPAEAQQPALLEKEKARLNAQKLAVRDVDYQFEGDVAAALNKLRSGASGPLLRSDEQKAGARQKSGASTGRSHKTSSAREKALMTSSMAENVAGTEQHGVCAEEGHGVASQDSLTSPQEPPVSPVQSHPTATHPIPAAQGPTGTTPPVCSGGEGGGSSAMRAKPPALTTIEQDNDDADQFQQDEVHEKLSMQLFAFGAQDGHAAGDDDEVPHFNAMQQHSGSEVEEELIADDLDAARRADQKKRPSRMGISDASVDLDEARIANFPPTPKSRDKVKIITKVLERHYLFSFLDDSDIAKFASIMDLERFEAGSTIVTKGEHNDTLFLILTGDAEAVVDGPAEGEEEVLVLGQGATFGDVGLMYDTKNAMTVTAKTDVQCASLERKTYKMVTSRSMTERRENYTNFISSVPFFGDLPREEVTRVAESLKAATYMEGDKILSIGAEGEWLHFIVEGVVEVRGADGQRVATVEKGGVVGHLEFLFHHPAVADVVAASPVVRTAKLSRHQFDRVVSSARAPMVKDVEESSEFQYFRDAVKGTGNDAATADGP